MIILRRTLTYAASSGEIAVDVYVHAPEQREHDWSCRYEIGWPDEKRAYFGFGIDATQALLLTLKMVGAEIYTSDYHRSGQLGWFEPGGGYGYPVSAGLRDLLVGDDIAEFG